MSNSTDLKAILTSIDAATTAQAASLRIEAAAVLRISDAFDALIEQVKANIVTPELLAVAQLAADHASAIATSLQSQADFSTAIAAKDAPEVVPPVVPPPAVDPGATVPVEPVVDGAPAGAVTI